MTDEEYLEDTGVANEGVGQRLQMARQDAGHSLADVAKATRIPERHLAAIENGEFNRLPAPTYAVGFSRSYARMLGLDEHAIVEQVRAELAATQPSRPVRSDQLEPGDPARVPSRRLAWFGVAAIVLLLVGMVAFYRSYLSPGIGPAPLTAERRVAANQAAGGGLSIAPAGQAPNAAGPVANANGQVVLTAQEDGVWAKFYDGAGNRLQEKQMARGETFAVPRDVAGVQIWTGRPDAFAITIDGRPVPRLAEVQQIVRDVPITAQALLARGNPAPGAGQGASVAPVGTSAPSPVPVGN